MGCVHFFCCFFSLQLLEQSGNNPMSMIEENLVKEGNGKLEKNILNEKELCPNLQLSLSQSLGDVGGKEKCHSNMKDSSSSLSLSLSQHSSKHQGQSSEKYKDRGEPEIQFLGTDSSNKAATRLSTLDLTMSIQALE